MRPLLSAAIVLLLHAGGARADAYDDQVRALSTAKATFGHDVDVADKLGDFLKNVVDVVKLPKGFDNLTRLKRALTNAYDTGKGLPAAEALSPGDFNKYVAKVLAEEVSPKEIARLKALLGKTTATVGSKVAIDVTDAASKTLPDGDGRETAEAVVLAAIDSLCEPCVVSRSAALVAIEKGREMRAAFQDERTRALYEAWKASRPQGESVVPEGLRGAPAAYNAARESLIKQRSASGASAEVTADDVDAFILKQFRSWAKGEAEAAGDAGRLAEAKPYWTALTNDERAAFGKTDKERVAGFADVLPGVWDMLTAQNEAHRGTPLFAPRDKLLAAAVKLAVLRADAKTTAPQWRKAVRDTAEGFNWPADGGDKTATAGLVRERLALLNHYKMQALFDHIGVPKALRANFYACLCSQVPHGGGVSYIYDPSTGKAPCSMVGGLGVDFQDFPNDAGRTRDCYKSAQVPDDKGRRRDFDEYVADLVEGKR